MIFANGTLLPDTERKTVLDGLETQLNAVRAAPPLEAETVIRAVDALGKRLEAGEFAPLLARFLPAGVGLDQLLPLLRREALEAKLAAELGPEPFRPVKLAKTTARALPLGVLFHIAPGNMPGLPVYTALEGLLTGNINLIKLPHGDKGLSLAAFQLLAEQEPRLAPYLYAFDLSSGQREELDALAALADGLVAWGGDGAIEAARTLAGPGCKLIEWGHRLSFAYVSGFENRAEELSALGVPFSRSLTDTLAPDMDYAPGQFLPLLREHWGAPADFRELQFYDNPSLSKETVPVSQGSLIGEIVDQCEQAMEGETSFRDIFITAPTGAGKSLLFQLPALYLAEKYALVTIVVTPLIALMHDQVAQLESERGVTCATYLDSKLTFEERQHRIEQIRAGEKSILYLAPELLLATGLRPIIGDRPVGLMVIDEAHTVTTWGRDFRPDYWFLGDFLRSAKREGRCFPVLCLTATAVYTGADDVVNETISELGLHHPVLHLGCVKRENILFDINLRERADQERTSEELKIEAIVRRIQTYVAKRQRFLVYCPFKPHVDAVYAALPAQTKSWVRRYYSGDRISDTERRMAEADYRCGRALGLVCTKAFGMGVDVSDIQHIIHFAPSGSLADYVQEIGRAARDQTLVGVAHMDFYQGDIRYARALSSMSETKQYQLKGMLKKLCDVYDVRRHRNLLVSSESFAYLFKEQDLDNKVKNGLLMLAKDLKYKYGFPVLIVRPQAMLTTNYVNVPPALEKEFLRQFGDYAQPMGTVPDRVISSRRQGASDTRVHNVGSIYRVRIGDLWQSRFADQTFAAFKFRFFQEGILKGGSDSRLSPRIRAAVNYHGPFQEIVELVTGLLENIQTVLDGFEQAEKKSFDEKSFRDSLNALRPGRELSQTQTALLLDMFTLTASEKAKYTTSRRLVKILQLRSKPGEGGHEYIIRGTLMKDYLLRLLHQCTPNYEDRYQAFVPIGQTDAISILPILKLIEILELASYELRGGEKSEIFIRINDPYKLRRLAEGNYSNAILQEVVRRHRASQKLLQDFFTTDLSDEERWDLIEDHFLGREEDVAALLAQG